MTRGNQNSPSDLFSSGILKTGNMKTIQLTQDKTALVDDEDYDYLMQWKWCYSLGYAISRVPERKSPIRMHRLILGILDKSEILTDHKNRNRLDNRRDNLRICNRTENNRNITSYGKSKYLGVCRRSYDNRIMAQIRENGQNKFLGYFNSEEEAARVYDFNARRIYGEFANLNFKHETSV